MARSWAWGPDGAGIDEDGRRDWSFPGVSEDNEAAPAGGRIMSSLAGSGGLAHKGGIAGIGGGLAA